MKKIIGVVLGIWIGSVGAEKISEKPIVVVVPSFNNKEWYQKNLDSIFLQNYSNFTVIYIDDASDDGTGLLVQQYLQEKGWQEKCTLIINDKRYGPLYNRYKAIHSCPDNAIIVLVDGDDWLAHENVFTYINTVYAQNDIYMTVGNACKSSTGKPIGYRDYTKNELETLGVRQLGFRGVHPRTFYAWLFKKIKLEDLFEGEKLYPMATDVACLLPMFEMAQHHYKFIKDILYVYNDQNPLNMARTGFQTQLYCDMMIRNQPSYTTLSPDHLSISSSGCLEVEGIVFMTKTPDTSSLITTCSENNIMWNKWIVIGRPDHDLKIFDSYKERLEFLNMGCDLQTIYSLRINIKDHIKKSLNQSVSSYVFIMTDELLNVELDLTKLCTALENTDAFAIVVGDNPSVHTDSYYSYDENEKHSLKIIRPWMFSQSFSTPQGCKGILLKKEKLLTLVDQMTVFYPHFSTLLAAWHSLVPLHSVLLINFLK